MTVCLTPTRSPSLDEALATLTDEILAPGQARLLEADLARWREDLQRRLQQLAQHPEQGLGFIEEHIRQASLERQRLRVQKTMQDQADTVAEKCPDCGARLTAKKRRVPRWIDAYCGKVKLLRSHGWCPHCQCWHFPADRMLVIADGAVWIWNLVADRFQEAVQRLDLYPANTYLWAVANELHGAGTREARQWVKPLLRQVRNDQVAQVITQLEELQPRLAEAAAKTTGQTIEYYQNNRERMKYKEGRQRQEPVGAGAIESTCRQLQCRFKRTGQFWSTRGDAALLCWEMFWRNERWEMLFPHAKLTAANNN